MRGAHPERSIHAAIQRGGVVRAGDRVLIACSGGPDSIALTAALHAVAKPMRLALQIAHVNHGVRASAGQDECVVACVAAGLGLPLGVAHLVPLKRGEASLRDARYTALVAAAKRSGSTVVATAHHAEDQSETILLALFRGAGPEGLGGMRARRPLEPHVDLARPFLQIPADALRHYCHLRGLPYAIDPTNADLGLRRNAVRDALEALRPLFPGLDGAVARAAGLVGDESESAGRADLRRHVRARLAREEELRDVDFVHIEAAVRALETGGSGSFHMKAGVRLEIRRGGIAGITRG
ncbi:MAG: tRNA lysidine(34) synthetase TilS [Candidatus Tumulicola sp.]